MKADSCAKADSKGQMASTRRAIESPTRSDGASIARLEAFALRGQELLRGGDLRADARLDSSRRTTYRLAGNRRSVASDVEVGNVEEFGCGLRIGDRDGLGFAVGEGGFSWPELVSAAKDDASEAGGEASSLPPFREGEFERQDAYPSPTEMTAPPASWLSGVHEELRGIGGEGVVLEDLRLSCKIGWRAVLSSGGACLLRNAHDLRLTAVGAVKNPWGERWPVSLSVGSTHDWCGLAEALLRAVSGLGEMLRFDGREMVEKDYLGPVVLDPQVAGFLVHEAIGHLSEADRLPQHVRHQIAPGGRVRVGPSELNVTDHADDPLVRGGVPFDDEGVRCIGAPLVRGGHWEGLLHSRETASVDSAAATGNARTTSYRHRPLCRMRTTEMHGGSTTRDDLLADSGDALYVGLPQEGEVPGGNVRIRAWAWRIRNGEIRECQGPVTLIGEAPTVLREIEVIGSDRTTTDGHPGCGRKGQSGLLPVSVVAPTVRLRSANVRF